MTRELRFRFPLPQGLHARPAGVIRDAATGFRSTITLTNLRTGREANARSALALLATLTQDGDECVVLVAGDDEEDALAAMQRCVSTELPLCGEQMPAPSFLPGAARPLPRALRGETARVLCGVPASGGIGRGRALTAVGGVGWPDVSGCETGPPDEEATKLERAVAEARTQLRQRLQNAGNATDRAILEVQLAIVEDVELRDKAMEAVRTLGLAAEHAVVAAAQHFVRAVRDDGSPLLAERALDIRDVAVMLVRAMQGDLAGDERVSVDRDAVLVAQSLGPSQLMSLDRTRLKGIVLGEGGATSHTSILARACGIPCVIGLGTRVRMLDDGRDVIVDGERGLVVPDPSPAVARFYAAETEVLRTVRQRLEVVAARPAATADGRPIEIGANVGSLPEVRLAFASGAEGIGLFRTEFLFMDRAEAPSEDEQTQVYAEAVRLAAGRPVIIRTLDVGGDKPLPYLHLPDERNPFLGFRGIRIYDTHGELIAAQIRAILRAATEGVVKIMFPMIGSVEDARMVRRLVEEQMEALVERGVPFGRDIEVGIMVEVPALAFVMDTVAAEVDFFSIGSNDLLQYVLAVDRANQRVAHLYDPLQPSFLRAVDTICTAARTHGKWIGLCGELGADPLAVPVLVGLGLDEISVGCADVAAVKSAVSRYSASECRQLATAAASAETAAEVRTRLHDFARSRAARAVLEESLVRLRSARRSKDEAIRELVDLLVADGRVSDADVVEDAVWAREDVAPTAVGFGLAIPHCTAGGVVVTSIAVASYEHGVDWHATDGGPVHMAILIAVPADAAGEAHLRTIAALSRRLMDDEFRTALLAAASPATVVELLHDAMAESGSGT